MIKKDANLIFHVKRERDYGGSLDIDLLGVYQDFDIAKKAMQISLLDDCYSKYNEHKIDPNAVSLKDLLKNSLLDVGDEYSVIAMELDKPLNYENQMAVFSAQLTGDASSPIHYYAISEMGVSYAENEERINSFVERIRGEFDKNDPDINLTKNLQRSMEAFKRKKIFMESIVENKKDLVHLANNCDKIMNNVSSGFLNSLEENLKEYDPKLCEKIKSELDSNKNSGIMEKAFEKSRKNRV